MKAWACLVCPDCSGTGLRKMPKGKEARERIVDLRVPGVSCLTLVDDLPGEDRTDAHPRYWLGPPAGLRFLALRPMSANLKMRFVPGSEATILPIGYLLTDDQGHISQGEIRGETVDFKGVNFPKGPSFMQPSVKAKGGDPEGKDWKRRGKRGLDRTRSEGSGCMSGPAPPKNGRRLQID